MTNFCREGCYWDCEHRAEALSGVAYRVGPEGTVLTYEHIKAMWERWDQPPAVYAYPQPQPRSTRPLITIDDESQTLPD